MTKESLKKLCFIGGTALLVGIGIKWVFPALNQDNKFYGDTPVITVTDLTHHEIGNSILSGSKLDSFLKGQAKEIEDNTGNNENKLYVYTDGVESTYIAQDSDGKNVYIDQIIKYDDVLWKDIMKFYKTLGNKERSYVGLEFVEKIEWDKETTDVMYSGQNEEFYYEFRRFQSFISEDESGNKSGFDGTGIRIYISKLDTEISKGEILNE